MSLLALIWVVLAAPPQIQLTDLSGCIEQGELARELEARLPKVELRPLTLQLDTKEEPAGEVTIHMTMKSDEGELLDRTLQIAAGDCPAAPGLIARIIAQHLEGLAGHLWKQEKTPLPLAPTKRTPPTAPPQPAPTLSNDPLPWHLRSGLELGLGLGFKPAAPRMELGGRLALGRNTFRLLGGGVLSVGRREQVPGGSARIWSMGVLLGLGSNLESSRFELFPFVGIVMGVQFARGVGFDQAATDVLPQLSLRSGLTLFSRRRIYAKIGMELPLFVVRVAGDKSGEAYEEPALRALLSVGYSWHSTFF